MAEEKPGEEFLPLAEIEIDRVEATGQGFRLSGTGPDSGEYRLDMHLDVPVDRRTRAVLSELLAQTEWRIWRRARTPLNPKFPRQLGTKERSSKA
ncbi:MAG: hypothetical protein KatS3mg081_2370 [Gemmatimonadales bacterium]|nr:hypothetical protein HRbin33_00875 [bacterium HR33]GIW53015.1 MAG: hypothetical protein KatS3mg081_2370 [Gemmatimonadales bacterium]